MKRIVLGGLLGGVLLFVWGTIAHVALPLGSAGISFLPQEEKTVNALKETVSAPGFYMFPGHDLSIDAAKREQAWQQKYTEGPVGILLYSPKGWNPVSASQMGTQFLSEVAAATVASYLLTLIGGTFWSSVVFVTLLGSLPWLVISVPYWNWYGYPGSLTMATLVSLVVGWFVMGVVLNSTVLKRPAVTKA
jgi:hypothetical protein